MEIARKIQEDRETELDERRQGRLHMAAAAVVSPGTRAQPKKAGTNLGHNFDQDHDFGETMTPTMTMTMSMNMATTLTKTMTMVRL